MAEAAKKLGYAYLAITEHSKRVVIAHGMDEKRLRRQLDAIDRLNERLEGIRVLKGICLTAGDQLRKHVSNSSTPFAS